MKEQKRDSKQRIAFVSAAFSPSTQPGGPFGGFEAMLWLREGFGLAGAWTVCEQNQLLSVCFGLPTANKA